MNAAWFVFLGVVLAMGRKQRPQKRGLLPASAAALDWIGAWEGWEPRHYNDPAGYCTVGYGHLVGRRPCSPAELERPPLTREAGRALLQEDLAREVQPLAAALENVQLGQRASDALSSWCFNVGGRAAAESTLVRRLQAGGEPHSVVSAELLKWNKAGGVVFRGLVRRREAERDRWMTGRFDVP